MSRALGDWLRAAALLVAATMLTLLGASLVCVGIHADSGSPCGGACGALARWRSAPCTDATAEVPHEMALYAAVIDTIYQPRRYASIRAPRGVLFLQSQTIAGVPYVNDPRVLAALRTLLPQAADTLLLAFRIANATPSRIEGLWTIGPTYLDSSTVRRILSASDADARREPVVSDVLAGLPLDSLPGILTLSLPVASRDGRSALIFATLRERRAPPPDHLEAAAFLLLARDDFTWRVVAELPIPLARAR